MKIRLARKRSRIVMFAMPDIAFLLLIFLILTVSVAENEDIAIPSFKFTQETDFPEVVIVRIDRGGTVEIGEVIYDDEGMQDAFSRIGEGRIIHVIADREVAYASVDTVLSGLKSAGLRDVILIAESDDNL